MPTLQGNYGPNMNAFWWVVAEIYTTWETLTQNFDANSTQRKEVQRNAQTNERTYERKDENYIPLGINARGIINAGGIITGSDIWECIEQTLL